MCPMWDSNFLVPKYIVPSTRWKFWRYKGGDVVWLPRLLGVFFIRVVMCMIHVRHTRHRYTQMVVAWNYWNTVLFLLWYVTVLFFLKNFGVFSKRVPTAKIICKCWLVAVWPDICTWWIWEKWIKSWSSHWNTDFLRRSAQFSEASIHKFPKPFTYNLPLPHSKYLLWSGVHLVRRVVNKGSDLQTIWKGNILTP